MQTKVSQLTMARMLAMTTVTVVALCLVAAEAAAYDENHAFRAPVVELPQLAKSEPIEFGQIASGRRLLRADPSKSLWDKKLGVRRDTETRFGQGSFPDPICSRLLGSPRPFFNRSCG